MSAKPRPLPPPLPAGGRIGLVALASPLDGRVARRGVRLLEEAGFEVVLPGNLGCRDSYLAGDDGARLEGLREVLGQHPHALLATRGGYGVMRVLPHLPWAELARWGGWVVGFSDLTALHAGLSSCFPCATLHGPMLGGMARSVTQRADVIAWLEGRRRDPLFRIPPSGVLRAGRVRGVSAGGNLSLLAALVGTSFEPDYDGAVLFLEDVGEPAYRLDRLLTQLTLSSRLPRVAAVVVGEMTRCGGTGRGWRSRWRRLLLEAAPQAVVVDGVGFGHGSSNLAFPLGVEVVVDTAERTIRLGGG